MSAPRTQCPFCASLDIDSLGRMVLSKLADYFRCSDCHETWSVPKGADGPVSPIRSSPCRRREWWPDTANTSTASRARSCVRSRRDRCDVNKLARTEL